MREIKYSEVLRGMAGLMGFPLGQLTEDEVSLWFEAINEGTRFAWEYIDWPGLCDFEEVDVDEDGFFATPEDSLIDVPASVDFYDGFYSPVKVLNVFSQDPRPTRNPLAVAVRYRNWTDRGFYTPDLADGTAWVFYKKGYRDYRGYLLREGEDHKTFIGGTLLYIREDWHRDGFERFGDWWLRHPNPTTGDNISKLPYPYVLSSYAMRAGAAQLLETEGKPGLATYWRKQAMEQLDIEVERACEMDPFGGAYLGPGGGVVRGPRGFGG